MHFAGRLNYADYLRLLQVSSAHIYLTYPFVLSWSLMESMAASCIVIGSRTAPVEEVITHKENGLLVDFFDIEEINDAVTTALNDGDDVKQMQHNARRVVSQKYDLTRQCLPKLKEVLIGKH